MGVDARATVWYGFRYEDLTDDDRSRIMKLLTDDWESNEEEVIPRLFELTEEDEQFFRYPNSLGSVWADYSGNSDPVGFGVDLAHLDWDTTDSWVELTGKVTWGLATYRITTDSLLDRLDVPSEVRGTFIQCRLS